MLVIGGNLRQRNPKEVASPRDTVRTLGIKGRTWCEAAIATNNST